MISVWRSCSEGVCILVLGVVFVVGTMDRHVAAQDATAVRTLLEDRRDKELAWQDTEVPAAVIQERNELQVAQEKLG